MMDMNRYLKLFILLSIFAWLAVPTQAQEEGVSKVGITAAPFLEIGVGSRAISMGGAFVGIADDASALYWNPAGISSLSQNEVLFVHTDWLVDISFDYVGTVIPLGRYGSLGANVTVLSMGEMEVRTVQFQEGTGEKFSASDFAAGLSYARNLTDRFSIGANVKYVEQRIWHMKASTVALDIGTMFNTQIGGLRIGTTISNFGPAMKMTGKDVLEYHDIAPNKMGNNEQILAALKTDDWSLPLTFQAGVAYDLFRTKSHRLTMAADAISPSDNTQAVNTGFEYALNEMIYIRGGLKSLFQRDTEESFTLGAGLHYKMFGSGEILVDYAYADFGLLDYVQRFSFSLRF